jgi:hypothetical protein
MIKMWWILVTVTDNNEWLFMDHISMTIMDNG